MPSFRDELETNVARHEHCEERDEGREKKVEQNHGSRDHDRWLLKMLDLFVKADGLPHLTTDVSRYGESRRLIYEG